MSSIEAPEITVVEPGGGQQGDLGTIGVASKLWGRDTGHAMSIVEHPFPVGALVPPHLHTREDEYSSSPRARSGSGLAIARSSCAPADTSPSRAGSCTPCGTPGWSRPG
jgi:hypothetical protein